MYLKNVTLDGRQLKPVLRNREPHDFSWEVSLILQRYS